MNNDFLAKYEQEFDDRIAKRVTLKLTNQLAREITEKVTNIVIRNVAKNFKDILPDEEIAKRTGLTLKEVQDL